jgi:hypothetical protein
MSEDHFSRGAENSYLSIDREVDIPALVRRYPLPGSEKSN